jgi:hypothetical protein
MPLLKSFHNSTKDGVTIPWNVQLTVLQECGDSLAGYSTIKNIHLVMGNQKDYLYTSCPVDKL